MTGHRRGEDTAARPAACSAVLIAGSMALSLFGAAAAVNLAFPLLAVGSALYLLVRGRHVAYVYLVLALWFFGSGVRRIVDWQSAYHETSPVLLAAPLASCLGVLFVAPRRVRLPVPALVLLTVFAVALPYASATGAVTSGVVPTAASAIVWLAPFLFGVYLAYTPVGHRELVRHLADASWIPLTVLGGYGVLQWVLAPEWDTQWMTNIDMNGLTFGTPEAFGIRVFSLVNSPYSLGCVLVVLLVTQLVCPLRPSRVVALALGLGALGLSGVRAAWIALLLAIVALAVRRQLNAKIGAVGALLVTLGIAFAPADFTETVSDRVDSLGSGSSDVSYAARDQFYSTVVPQLLGDPIGGGLGSTGAGVRASGSGTDTTFRDVDSTYLELLKIFGSVFGLAICALMVGTCLWLWVRTGSRGGPVSAWSALVAAAPVLAVLGDVWGGSNGALMWAGLVICARAAARDPVPEPPIAQTDVAPTAPTTNSPTDRRERVAR